MGVVSFMLECGTRSWQTTCHSFLFINEASFRRFTQQMNSHTHIDPQFMEEGVYVIWSVSSCLGWLGLVSSSQCPVLIQALFVYSFSEGIWTQVFSVKQFDCSRLCFQLAELKTDLFVFVRIPEVSQSESKSWCKHQQCLDGGHEHFVTLILSYLCFFSLFVTH